MRPEQHLYKEDKSQMVSSLHVKQALHWLKSKKKEAVIMKLDFHKAYDFVKWDFVDQVLARIGFGQIWRKWIWGYLSSAKVSIIINNSPSKPFRMERGLR